MIAVPLNKIPKSSFADAVVAGPSRRPQIASLPPAAYRPNNFTFVHERPWIESAPWQHDVQMQGLGLQKVQVPEDRLPTGVDSPCPCDYCFPELCPIHEGLS